MNLATQFPSLDFAEESGIVVDGPVYLAEGENEGRILFREVGPPEELVDGDLYVLDDAPYLARCYEKKRTYLFRRPSSIHVVGSVSAARMENGEPKLGDLVREIEIVGQVGYGEGDS